ncbi:MAG: L-threonylcarbamoyladenylate synthase [Candidatus Diapherotrites archaeon]
METVILKINPKKPEIQKIKIAANIIKRGGLVVFPTETVYGLGANALDRDAIKRIFETKGRPADNPIIVHIYKKRQLNEIAMEIPDLAYKLIEKFWPGPLTLILKKKEIIPPEVTGGLKTIAVRMPSHKVARALCKASGIPIAAPSANLSGKPSITTGKDAIDELAGKVECIIDAGATDIGLESTVLDLTSDIPEILRPGGITAEEIRKVFKGTVVGEIAMAKKNVASPKSPGTKYRHYAPKAMLVLVEGDEKKAIKKAENIAIKYAKNNKKVALLRLETTKLMKNTTTKIRTILLRGKKQIAKKLFSSLRMLDAEGTDIIVTNAIDEKGLGLAIMNRLRKASSYTVKI